MEHAGWAPCRYGPRVDDDLEYTTRRPDLAQALEELVEAGFEVVYWSMQSTVMTGADLPEPAFCVRIRNEVEHWDGMGPSEDYAFSKALEAFAGK